MKFPLDIVVRTCDFQNVHTDRQRFVGVPKTDLIIKCVSSLVASANRSSDDILFKIIDDHSSDRLLTSLEQVMKKSRHPHEFFHMEERGYNASAVKQFEMVRDAREYGYSIEDDYLHFPEAISEMIEEYQFFSKQVNSTIALFPFNDPDNYIPPWVHTPCNIVHGHARHWRTTIWTTNTFLTHKSVLQQHWNQFHVLAAEYNTEWGKANNIHEGTTIVNVWKNHVPVFAPIPSLALHMQFDRQKDPFINWQQLWNSIDVSDIM